MIRTAVATLLAISTFPLAPLAPTTPPVRAQVPQQAPEDSFLLPDIVVTGTRVPVRTEVLPTPATVLTGGALRARGISSVAEALRLVPGLAVVRAGSAGAQTSLFMRGGESNYVKILVDGIPVNEAGGMIDLADLSTDLVERIEVARGPVSVLYGSDAVSGVVQIFTLRGRGAPVLEATILGGRGERRHGGESYPLVEGDVTVSGSAGNVSYAVGGARSWTEGAYPFNNERTLQTANARMAWSVGTGSHVAVATRFSDSESGYPTDGAGNLVDENAALDRRLWSASVETTHRFTPHLEAQLQLGGSARDQTARDEQDSPADTFGVFASRFDTRVTRRSADLRVNADVAGTRATVGLAHELASGSMAYDSRSEWGPLSTDADYERSNRAAYLQVLAEPIPSTHLTLGARVDDNEAFGRFDTFRVGLSQGIGEWTRVRGAIGRAFREPSFGENFGSGFDNGNPNLVPERTRGWEVGADYRIGPLLTAATWFDQRFDDLIQYTSATADPTDPNYVNVGAAEAVGLELSAEVALGRMELSGSFTRLGTRVLDPGLASDQTFVEGASLLRRPARSGSLAGQLRRERGNVGLTIHLVGEREDMDFGAGFPAPRVTLPRYATVDIAGEHALPLGSGDGVRVLLRAENLLDAEYQGVAGFPGPGRILRLGARFGLGR